MAKERRRLRSIRADKEPALTQSQAARRAGLGSFRWWQIENGEGRPATADEKTAAAAALGVKVTDIAWPELDEPAPREATA